MVELIEKAQRLIEEKAEQNLDDYNLFVILSEMKTPVPMTWDGYKAYCGACGRRIYTKCKPKYCHKCGRMVQ